MVTKHLLSAAASMAAIGGPKETQLNFGEAASYYRQAAELSIHLGRGRSDARYLSPLLGICLS